jgi:hypothetical protein
MVDLIVVLALLGTVAALTIPRLDTAMRQVRLERLARQVASDTHRCRAAAVRLRRNVGLVFTQEGSRWSYKAVVDGDGDGVSRRDVEGGVDRQIQPKVAIDSLCPGARLGVPAGWRVPDPSGRGRLRSGSGVRAGRWGIISFSSLGDATPATLYFNDGRERLLAVRIYGGTARIRALEWRLGWPSWRRVSL